VPGSFQKNQPAGPDAVKGWRSEAAMESISMHFSHILEERLWDVVSLRTLTPQGARGVAS